MNIAIFAPNFGRVPEPWSLSAQEVMKKTGNNTGNLAYWYSAPRLFDAKFHLVQGLAHAEQLKGKVDLFLFPASNQLNQNSDMGTIADIIETLDIPCLVIGLGAQSETESTFPKLKDGTVRFVQEVAKRTPSILCRGNYTKSLLESLGVNNVMVGGCSTIFINDDVTLGKKLEKRIRRKVDRVNIASGQVNPAVQSVERKLLGFLEQIGSGSYTIQHPPILFKALINDDLSAEEKSICTNLARRFLDVDASESLVSFLHRYASYHLDVESWMLDLSLHTHSIGTRIHGNILALQSEIPALCITTDTRTRELCEVLKVPSIQSENFSSSVSADVDLNEVFSWVDFSAREFDENRLRLAAVYSEIFKDLGVPLSSRFEKFCV